MTTPLLVHVVGARPNFPKAAPVIAALRAYPVEQLLVHTGQHYDPQMSAVFFRELNLPQPDVTLGVGSGSHATQTAAVMVALEGLFIDRQPAMVVVYGDVNSTVAAALVASKLHIPLTHVEAGLRSHDRRMPEEINRLLTDRISDLLLVTSADAVSHLLTEGVDPDTVHLVGNPMIDTLATHRHQFDPDRVTGPLGLTGTRYVAATVHRPANVDEPDQARTLVNALHAVADHVPLILPLHPRGRDTLVGAGLLDHGRIHVLGPLGYIDFLSLLQGAAAVVTDSGGVQEETTALGVPCLTIRANTERPVTLTEGTNRLVSLEHLGAEVTQIVASEPPEPGTTPVPPLWDGQAGPRIAAVLADTLDLRRGDRAPTQGRP